MASLLRRGLDGLGDYQISILKGDRVLDWQANLKALDKPFRICRGAESLLVDAGYVDRTREVSPSPSYSSPYWEEPREAKDSEDERLGGGTYKLETHLHGFGPREIWTARGKRKSRFLATISAAKHTPELEDRLSKTSPGLLAYAELVSLKDGGSALLEELPAGESLAQVSRAVNQKAAARVLAEVGETVLAAIESGVEFNTIHPQLVWVLDHGDELELTGLTDRPDVLFAEEPAACFGTTPIWVRRYLPDYETGQKALAFNLALLLCQLQIGAHPIPTIIYGDYVDLMPTLENAYELLPSASAELVRKGLEQEPHDRIGLAEIVARLRELAMKA